MAGLQEQVRQLEEVNEDMLEETTRYGDNRFRESTRMWADPRLGLLRCCLMFPRLGHRERRARKRSLSTFVLYHCIHSGDADTHATRMESLVRVRIIGT